MSLLYKVFLDSGAFSLAAKAKKKLHVSEKAFYKTKDFWGYVDEYASFIKRFPDCFDYYANVDTSRFPKITWDVQHYLEEEHGLKPLPVIHHGEPMKWLEKYLNAGYKYICIGGVAKGKGYSRPGRFLKWGDEVFRFICPDPENLPIVKTHGFGITNVSLMRRYPWTSIDSVTWKKPSYYGQIVVPFRKNGKFDPLHSRMIFVDLISPYSHRDRGHGKHFLSFSKAEQQEVLNWLEEIGTPFGQRGGDGSIIKHGVSNSSFYRCQATIRYFEYFRKCLPKRPWEFDSHHRPTLLQSLGMETRHQSNVLGSDKKKRLVIYHAGAKPPSEKFPWDHPMIAAEMPISIMLTFYEFRGKCGKKKRKFLNSLKRINREDREFYDRYTRDTLERSGVYPSGAVE